MYFYENLRLNLYSFLKTKLTGLEIGQEYCCLDLITYTHGLRVMAFEDGGGARDISREHIFLGYKPLLIGVVVDATDEPAMNSEGSEITLVFDSEISELNSQRMQLARLTLSCVCERNFEDGFSLRVYQGTRGSHTFLRTFHRFSNYVREKMKRSIPGNVSLPGNLADQVRIAYAVPRIISVITTGDGERINMFPTDLHGAIGTKFYASSLRTSGRANQQVCYYKKVVISEISSSEYKRAYAMGKNHMRDLAPESDFAISQIRSEKFDFPLPHGVTRYTELIETDGLPIGIHTLHFYKVISHHQVSDSISTLAHHHQYYAQWRQNKGMPIALLKR